MNFEEWLEKTPSIQWAKGKGAEKDFKVCWQTAQDNKQAEIDALTARITELEKNLESVTDLACWLAEIHMKWHTLRYEAMYLQSDECRDFLKGNFPIIQGSNNQENIRKIGDRKVKQENIRQAIMLILEKISIG